jgi:hypothetical protein
LEAIRNAVGVCYRLLNRRTAGSVPYRHEAARTDLIPHHIVLGGDPERIECALSAAAEPTTASSAPYRQAAARTDLIPHHVTAACDPERIRCAVAPVAEPETAGSAPNHILSACTSVDVGVPTRASSRHGGASEHGVVAADDIPRYTTRKLGCESGKDVVS